MVSASFWERSAPKLTMAFSLLSIIGLFALMTLPPAWQLQPQAPVSPRSAEKPSQNRIHSYVLAPQKPQSHQHYTTVSRFRFADTDLTRYRTLYSLQEAGNWPAADALMRKPGDTALLGDLLAQRFLHADYLARYDELDAWLLEYADHPDAARIRKLALRKRPAKITVPAIPRSNAPGMRYGLRDGMGGRSMPRGWRAALRLYEQGKHNNALTRFRTIAQNSTHQWVQSTAHYWAHRSAKATGEPMLADYHLREAALHPFTFYGAMAATQLTPALYRARFSQVSADIRTLPGIHRAAAFVALGERDKAKRELLHLYGLLEPHERPQLVTIAAAFDLPSLQLRFSQMQHRDPQMSDITAYPTPGWVPHYDMQVDPALVYAIIRQESAFNTRAKSHAGARGAMQIMPATADYMIRLNRLNEVHLASLDMTRLPRAIGNRDLYRPEVNLLIGQHYIRYLSEKPYIGGNLVHLLAAYNAGPGNLRNWQRRFAQVNDPLLFIEKIPFKETRHYVKQVMANYLIYQAMLYGRTHGVIALRAGRWPVLSTQIPRQTPAQQAQQALPAHKGA